jgi:hypothetical protein
VNEEKEVSDRKNGGSTSKVGLKHQDQQNNLDQQRHCRSPLEALDSYLDQIDAIEGYDKATGGADG